MRRAFEQIMMQQLTLAESGFADKGHACVASVYHSSQMLAYLGHLLRLPEPESHMVNKNKNYNVKILATKSLVDISVEL